MTDTQEVEAAVKVTERAIRREVEAQVVSASEIVAWWASQLAPVDTGALQASIQPQPAESSKGKVVVRIAPESGHERTDAKGNVHDPMEYAAQIEFKRKSYLRAAADQLRDFVTQGIEQAVRRAAK